MQLHIYIFRHGETYYNRSKRFTGRVNSRLTPEGIQQSKVLAEKLRAKTFQIAFKTSLSRSSDTLQLILKYHPECKRVIVDDRMIERSYGALERKCHKTIIKRYGKVQFDAWHRSYDVAPLGGESIQMVEKRVHSFIGDLMFLMQKEKANIAIAAHGNSMRPFRRHFEKLTVEEMMNLETPYDQFFDYVVSLDNYSASYSIRIPRLNIEVIKERLGPSLASVEVFIYVRCLGLFVEG